MVPAPITSLELATAGRVYAAKGEFAQLGMKLALPTHFYDCQLFLLAPCLSSVENLRP